MARRRVRATSATQRIRITGAIISGGSAANSQVLIGTPVPGVGNPLNGIIQAGHGIANTNYVWPTLVYAPRFGFAYDVNGKSNFVIRGGGGLFYDRPDGNTVFTSPANPPIATTQNLLQSQLQSLGTGLSPIAGGVAEHLRIQREDSVDLPCGISVSRNRCRCRWSSMCRMWATTHITAWGRSREDTTQMINQVPLGTAYLPQYQDPTLGAPTVPGAIGLHDESAPAVPGPRRDLAEYDGILGHVSLDPGERQPAVQPRVLYRGKLYPRDLTQGQHRDHVNTTRILPACLVLWSDEAAYDKLFSNLDPTPNYLKVNTTWNIPGITGRGAFLHVSSRATGRFPAF